MGRYLHNPPEPHHCPLPGDAVVGAIWVCDCGQHYHFSEGVLVTCWKHITPKHAQKLLAKIALNEETGMRVHRS
jgi:hypothetical protein